MTNPVDSTEQLTPNESDIGANSTIIKNNVRFSLLFVGLIFVVTLFLGVAIGYAVGRSQGEQLVQVVVTATADETVTQADDGSTQPTTATVQSEAGQPTPTIMDFVLSDTRHFQGSAGAPITMVEFSDFK
ncbi:MAG: hypothetical protein KDJ65_06195 [Anaerolineae bacterium]|nr:hypothetical protein [Anaerolineae bacterium]